MSLSLLTLLAISCSTSSLPQKPGPPALTGAYWLALSPDEREPFLSGFMDYYTAEKLGPITFGAPAQAYEVAISNHLAANPNSKSAPIAQIIEETAARVPIRPRRAQGEVYPGKHGYFDLTFWHMLGEQRLRVRFVEGFLEAQRRDPKSKDRFSRQAVWYADRVTEEFDRRPKDSETAIADLINLFRDK